MTFEVPTSRRPLAGAELNRALSGLSGSAWEERRSLENETDSFLYMEGLLSLAGRLERAHRPELATPIYAQVLESAEGPQRERARRRLAAWSGDGQVGDRAEVLLSRFSRELSDPVALFAMTAAGAAFRTVRFISLARLAARPEAGFLTRGIGARFLSHLAGFGSEALTFPLAARFGNLALGREQAWTGSALARETASSFLVLGALRAGGLLAGLAGTRTIGRPLAQQAGMFGGILLGHELEARVGLREKTRGAITLVDSLALLVQFNVAGRILRTWTGEGWANWERSIEARSALLERSGGGLGPPWGRGGILPEPLTAGPVSRLGPVPEPVRGPDRIYMSQGGEGGGPKSAAEVLIRAASLRVRITPPDAWSRRENLTREYLELLGQLSPGQAKTLEEILLGVEMLGVWASSPNSFLEAIGHRYYTQAWRIFRDKFSHVGSNFQLEQRLITNVQLHRKLISEGSNSGFLRHSVQASPAIASLLLLQRMALPEGSPRDIALLEALDQVLTVLHLGADMLPDANVRKAYLESWHDSLHAAHTTGERAAREVLSAIRMLREHLSDPEPERRELAALHYHNFWQLFRTVTQTNRLAGLDLGLSQEVAFLQQNRNLKQTPPQTLQAVLRAYPYYVDSTIALHRHHLTQLAMMLDVFVGLGRQFRGSIALAESPRTRELFVEAYVAMLRSSQEASLELRPGAHAFPRNVPAGVTWEIKSGLALLRERWSSENGDYQVRTFDQYWRLAERYPVKEGLADRLNSEPYLKPLVQLARFNSNREVRQAAETLLEQLLDRFRSDAWPRR